MSRIFAVTLVTKKISTVCFVDLRTAKSIFFKSIARRSSSLAPEISHLESTIDIDVQGASSEFWWEDWFLKRLIYLKMMSAQKSEDVSMMTGFTYESRYHFESIITLSPRGAGDPNKKSLTKWEMAFSQSDENYVIIL